MAEFKKTFFSIKLLIILIIVFCCCVICEAIAWVYMYDKASVSLKVTGLITGIFLIIKLLNLLFHKKLPLIKRLFILFSLILLLFISETVFMENRLKCYSSSITNMEAKKQIGKKYCIYVYNSNLKRSLKVICNEKVYHSIIVDKRVIYAMAYRTLTCFNNYSRLESISNDYADNRKHALQGD